MVTLAKRLPWLNLGHQKIDGRASTDLGGAGRSVSLADAPAILLALFEVPLLGRNPLAGRLWRVRSGVC
jgi:hypothetical protein